MSLQRSFIFRALSTLDRFGSNVTLQINGSQNYKHVLGAVITILTIGAAVALTCNIFSDFLNYTHPSVSSYTEYDLKSIDFNYSNFYFGVSFYDPIRGDSLGPGIRDNNYSTVKYINQLNLTCETCNLPYRETQMNLCAENQYSNKKIKSMSEIKSSLLINIFKNYSFCLPEGIQGTIEDLDTKMKNKTQDTSLSIFIPISSLSVEDLGIQKNVEVVQDASNPTAMVQTQTEQTYPNPSVPSYAQPSTNSPQPVSSGTQPVSSGTQPVNSGTQPVNSGTQPVSSGTQPTNTQPNTASTTNPTQPNTTPTTNPTQPTQPTNTQQNTASTTNPTQPTTNPTQPNTASTTNPTQPTTNPTQPTTNPTQPTQPTAQSGAAPSIRLLQTSSTIQTQEINTQMQEILNKFKFPKMMILNRSFELNPGATGKENLLQYIYNLEVLDYRDPLSGNPIVYDIYVQKKKVIVTKPVNFYTKTDTIIILTIQRIEKNVFDSLQNNGAYFSFKLYSDVEVIQINYVTISDVLSVFGSFFTTFTLAGTILANLYNDSFLQAGMINSVFNFVDNDPKDFENLEREIKNLMKNEKMKKKTEIEMVTAKEKTEKQKNCRPGKEIEEEKNGLNQYMGKEHSVVSFNASCKPLIVNEADLKVVFNTEKVGHNDKPKTIEEATLTKNIKEIENLEEDKIWENKLSLEEVHELNKIKKEKRKLVRISSLGMCMTKSGCKRFYNKKNVLIWEKVDDIVSHNLQIVTLIKRNMDVEELKKTLLSPKQLMLFNYYFKHINYKNYDQSMEFLNKCVDNQIEISKEALEDENDVLRGKIGMKLYSNFTNTYNF